MQRNVSLRQDSSVSFVVLSVGFSFVLFRNCWSRMELWSVGDHRYVRMSSILEEGGIVYTNGVQFCRCGFLCVPLCVCVCVRARVF